MTWLGSRRKRSYEPSTFKATKKEKAAYLSLVFMGWKLTYIRKKHSVWEGSRHFDWRRKEKRRWNGSSSTSPCYPCQFKKENKERASAWGTASGGIKSVEIRVQNYFMKIDRPCTSQLLHHQIKESRNAGLAEGIPNCGWHVVANEW